jgi:hypothetical protein
MSHWCYELGLSGELAQSLGHCETLPSIQQNLTGLEVLAYQRSRSYGDLIQWLLVLPYLDNFCADFLAHLSGDYKKPIERSYQNFTSPIVTQEGEEKMKFHRRTARPEAVLDKC